MKAIKISDMTMKQSDNQLNLSFKEKIELAKLLDRLGVDVIELEGIQNPRLDGLQIKSIASAVANSTVAVPVALDAESVDAVWHALSLAKHPRLQVCASVSPAQMEYLFHKKPEAMLSAISATTAACRQVCTDVEFVALDATRSEMTMLQKAITTAIDAGAATVTLCDSAGTMLPEEFSAFISNLYNQIPQLKDISLGICCTDTLALANACSIAAIKKGAAEIKASAYPIQCADLADLARILNARGDSLEVSCGISHTQLGRISQQIARICQNNHSKTSPFSASVQEDSGNILTPHDTIDTVLEAVQRLGYDLSEEDGVKVYEAFRSIATKKEQVSDKELDAIVASAAMQVPPTYLLDTFVITAGNTIAATAHMKLRKGEEIVEGASIGDGPIDAAFMAIEHITGMHCELDDFQIQAVTEGREAMGQTIVKLRYAGKVHSGRGISTDIVGASIRAYISALNKIVYEEEPR